MLYSSLILCQLHRTVVYILRHLYHLHTNTKKHTHICKQSNSQPYMLFGQYHPHKSTSVVVAFWYIVMIIVSTLEPLGLVSPTLYVYHHNNTFKHQHLMWKLIHQFVPACVSACLWAGPHGRPQPANAVVLHSRTGEVRDQPKREGDDTEQLCLFIILFPIIWIHDCL